MTDHEEAQAEDVDSLRARQLAMVMIVVFATRLGLAAFEGLPDLSRGFSMDSGAPELICLVWPICLGMLIFRLKWPSLMTAAAITMLVLVIHRLIGAGLGVLTYLEATVMSTSPWVRFTRAFELGQDEWRVAGRMVTRIGGSLIDAALMTMAIRIGIRTRGRSAELSPGNPRSVVARMAIVGSLVFAFLSIGMLAWDAYIHVLAFSPQFRQLVLREKQSTITDPRTLNPNWKPGRLLQLARGSYRQWDQGNAEGARKSARNALRQIKLATARRNSQELRTDRSLIAMELNNLAWALATGDSPEKDTQLTVDLARESVRLAPGEGVSWNTLGVALLRASSDQESEQAFERSMELRKGGDSFDWVFMAILRHRAGKPAEAKRYYRWSIDWARLYRPNDLELQRLQDETARVLGVPPPRRRRRHEPPKTRQSPGDSSSPSSSSSAERPLRKSASTSGSM